MKTPVLDKRSQADVVAQMRSLAADYTPEWKCDGDSSDPGNALLEVFANMFSQTIDRYNALPNKYYIEFLNLLGVKVPDPIAASGYVAFNTTQMAQKPVPVPKNTRLIAQAPDASGDVVYFETTRPIEATSAQFETAFFYSGRQGILQRLDFESEPQRFFAATDGENLQHHRLLLAQEDVLSIEGACRLTVEIKQLTNPQEEETAKRLSDSEHDGSDWVPFTDVKADGNRISMTKKEDMPMQANESGLRCICCELKVVVGTIDLKAIRISSEPIHEVPVDSMCFGDLPIEKDGGYCFGKRPRIYDLFYIRSDSVFCKRGSSVCMTMNMTTILDDPTNGEIQYDWSQGIISKEDAKPALPDDVTVKQVIWEYYNGNGWAPLATTGDRNPFANAPSTGKKMKTVFDIPDNISPTVVNAERGYFIRARVVEVENAMSVNPRWLLPFVKNVRFTWKYEKGYNAQYISAENNAGKVVLDDVQEVDEISLRAFEGIDDMSESVYLKFDKSPHAMPLALMFEVAEIGNLSARVQFEAYASGHFYPVRVADGTHNFRGTGVTCLYLQDPLQDLEMFGEKGYWLRLSIFTGSVIDQRRAPVIKAVIANAVSVIQRQQADDQYFTIVRNEAGKTLELVYHPVLDCEVWVDEKEEMTHAEITEMEKKYPEKIKAEWDDQILKHCWVRWDRVEDIRLAFANDRVYELDGHRGVVLFGDGICGRMVPTGQRNVRVSYARGGGTQGNLGVGAIDRLAGAVPLIGSVRSVTTTSGGVGEMPRNWVEEYGNRRVRHRNRALGMLDIEDMVAERFPCVRHVSCFSGRDEHGELAPSQVSVVFMCTDTADIIDTAAVAGDIYKWLAERCDCSLVAAGGLHVLPAAEIEVCVEVQVELFDLDLAAETQKVLEHRIHELIDESWRQHRIGDQIHLNDLFRIIGETPNVAAVRKVLAEGRWTEGGVHRSCDLSEGRVFPYATVRNGTHAVRIV